MHKPSKFIQVHIIESQGPNRSNTGATGDLKTVKFGGTDRVRISSQAIKSATRKNLLAYGDIPKDEISFKSKKWNTVLAPMLTTWEEESDRIAIAEIALNAFNRNPEKMFEEGENILNFVQAEVETIANLVMRENELFTDLAKRYTEYKELIELEKEITEVTEAAKAAGNPPPTEYDNIKRLKDFKGFPTGKEMKKFLSSIEANFEGRVRWATLMGGRMMATLGGASTESVIQVAHSISVNQVRPQPGIDGKWGIGQIDFFVAADELTTKRSGALIGEKRFSASTMYSLLNINLTELQKKLEGSETDVSQILKAYIKAFVSSSPSGGENGFAHNAFPEFVLIDVVDYAPISLVNAFEQSIDDAVDKKSIAHQAVERLMEWRSAINNQIELEPLYSGVVAMPGYAPEGMESIKLSAAVEAAIKAGGLS